MTDTNPDCSNIVIRSYLAASELLQSEPARWSAIVILDTGLKPTEFISKSTTAQLCLWFDDITFAELDKHLVETRHVQQAIDFAEQASHLLVSCRAGQSRSAAMAYAIAYHRFGETAALRLIDPTRHTPNRRVIELAASVLAKPELLATFEEWQMEHRTIKLADYYNRLESEVEAMEYRGVQNRITTE